MDTVPQLTEKVGAAAVRSMSNQEVVIVYEDFSTGLKAKRVFDELFGNYHLNMWEFKVLRLPALRAQAVRDATSAAMVCLAAHGEDDLPTAVKEWVDRWSGERAAHTSTLVVLVEAADAELASGTPMIESLRRAASQRGAGFFLGSIHAMNREEDSVCWETPNRL